MDEEVRKAIEKVRHKYVEAYHQNDAAAMAAVYADDAILLLPNDIIR